MPSSAAASRFEGSVGVVPCPDLVASQRAHKTSHLRSLMMLTMAPLAGWNHSLQKNPLNFCLGNANCPSESNVTEFSSGQPGPDGGLRQVENVGRLPYGEWFTVFHLPSVLVEYLLLTFYRYCRTLLTHDGSENTGR